MKKTVKNSLIVCGILFILGVGSCVDLSKGEEAVVDTTVKETQKTKEDDALADMLSEAKITKQEDGFDGFDVFINMKNTTDFNFEYIQIEYSVYNANNVKIGGSFVSMSNIEAGDSFRIKLDIYGEDARSYEIDKITGASI